MLVPDATPRSGQQATARFRSPVKDCLGALLERLEDSLPGILRHPEPCIFHCKSTPPCSGQTRTQMGVPSGVCLAALTSKFSTIRSILTASTSATTVPACTCTCRLPKSASSTIWRTSEPTSTGLRVGSTTPRMSRSRSSRLERIRSSLRALAAHPLAVHLAFGGNPPAPVLGSQSVCHARAVPVPVSLPVSIALPESQPNPQPQPVPYRNTIQVGGHTVTLQSAYTSNGKPLAQVAVDGSVYVAGQGETFPSGFQMLSIYPPCGGLPGHPPDVHALRQLSATGR